MLEQQDAGPPENETNESEDRAAEELSKLVGLAAVTKSREEQNAPETPKSPERSQNVIENKGPAEEGERA